MARKKTTIQEEAQPANVTALPKRRSRKKACVETMSETATGVSPLIPMDPAERYAFDQLAKASARKRQRQGTTSATFIDRDTLKPAQRLAWNRMWDMVIAKALPHVMAYLQEQEETGKAA